jgi:hypothetical protein
MVWTKITRPQYRREGMRYESDTTDGEWLVMEPLLPPPSALGRPRETEMRALVNAILYTGIPQMTPEPACILGLSQLSSKTEARFGRLPSTRAARTVVERLMWLFSPAFGHTAPVGCS